MSIFRSISNLLHPFRTTQEQLRDNNNVLFGRLKETDKKINELRSLHIKEHAISSQEEGVNQDKICDYKIIVSLTSYGKRIHEVYLAIESIMMGTLKPNRIILWLDEKEFYGKNLPIVLQRQMKRGLEIHYCENLRSYKKIIPTLRQFPDACVVTIDDDLIYEYDILEHLVNSYKENPNCVSACRTHIMKKGKEGKLLGYNEWGFEQHETGCPNMNFLTSGAGTLFPPHCFPAEMLDVDTFMGICPQADDVWINAMLRLNNVNIVKAYTHSMLGSDYIEITNQYETPLYLSNRNSNENMNDRQIKKVFSKYEIYERIGCKK